MLTISLESIYYKINTEYEYEILVKHNYSIIIDHNYKYCIISYYQLYILLGNKANIQYKYICNLCGKTFICNYNSIKDKYKKYQNLYCKPCIFIKKYGVRNPSQLDSIKKKKEQTTILHYGVKNPSQAQEIKEKKEQTSLLHYGVKYTLQAEEIKNRRKQANLQKYGAECTLQVEEVKEKIKQTNLQKYGVENPSQSLEIQRKKEQTMILHYGVKNPSQAEEIKEQIKQTNLKKYGVENPSQAQSIKDKKKQTMRNNLFNNNGNNSNNQHIMTSKQQLFFYQLFNSEFTILNYKFGNLFIDICFPQLKIGIEYNGGGHNLSVLHKGISQIDFIKKEIRRAYFLHKYNWNMIYIISPHDKINIYTSEEYIQIFNYITVLFNIYNETWCEIYIEDNYIVTRHYKISINYIINAYYNFDMLKFHCIYSLKDLYLLLNVNKRELSKLITQNNIQINKSYLNYRYIYLNDLNILLNKLTYLTTNEAIQYLNISYRKFYDLQKRNIIIPIIIDNKNMYNKQQLDQYLVMQQYYTPTKAAKYLNISLNQLYILNKKNKIQSININGKNRYNKYQLDQYIKSTITKNMLTYTEAAEYLHISLKTLYKLRNQNKIKTININGKNMYNKRQLKKYLKSKNK